MLTFSEYQEKKECEALVQALVEAEIDVYDFCDYVLEMLEQDRLTEESLYNELGMRNMLGGVSNLAGKAARVMGMGRTAGGMAGDAIGNAASAVGQGVANKYNQAAGAVGNAASSVGQGIANKYNQAKQAIGGQVNKATSAMGNAASAVGQGVANKYNQAAGAVSGVMGKINQGGQQSENAEYLKQAANAVMALQKQLQGFGYNAGFLTKAMAPIMQMIQHDQQQNQAQPGYKIGSQLYQNAKGGWSKGVAPAAPGPQIGAPPSQVQPAAAAPGLPMAQRVG